MLSLARSGMTRIARFPPGASPTRIAALLLATAGIAASAPAPHAEGPTRLTHDGHEKQRPAWTPDGSLLTFARHDANGPFGASVFQYLLEPESANPPRRLTHRELPEYHAVFSPDGRQVLLVVISQSGTQGDLDIARADRDGSNLKVVAAGLPGHLSHQDWPAWAPDGQSFAYSSTHDKNPEIYVTSLDGKATERLTQSPGLDVHPCFTPDGAHILFATDRWGGLELASMNRDGSNLTRLTHSHGLDDYPSVSPDGTKVAFVSNRDGNFEIYLCNLDGSGARNLTNHPGRDTQPVWTPDGRSITFLSNRDHGVDVYRLALDPAAGPATP